MFNIFINQKILILSQLAYIRGVAAPMIIYQCI